MKERVCMVGDAAAGTEKTKRETDTDGLREPTNATTMLRVLERVARQVAKKAPHVRDAAAIVRKERR